MNERHEDDMLVRLAVDDARTRTPAPSSRALASATSAAFMVALAEQEDLIRRAIADAGFSTEQLQLAAEHFEVAARDEWRAENTVGDPGRGGLIRNLG